MYDAYKDIVGIHYYFEQYYQYVIDPTQLVTENITYGMLYKKNNKHDLQLDM